MPVMTIRLSRRASARVATFAKKRRVTRSQVVRDAIEALGLAETGTVWDDWKHLEGIARGGPSDLATNPRHLEGFGRWRD
jgi:predicted transcriptional regulator